MDEKIKVKDLAVETGKSTTEIMRVLREEGIDFKSGSSSISREDAEKVKAHFQPEASGSVSAKEVQPGVIVRRRRRDAEDAAPSFRRGGKGRSVCCRRACRTGVSLRAGSSRGGKAH